jgi:hypothetical protein
MAGEFGKKRKRLIIFACFILALPGFFLYTFINTLDFNSHKILTAGNLSDNKSTDNIKLIDELSSSDIFAESASVNTKMCIVISSEMHLFTPEESVTALGIIGLNIRINKKDNNNVYIINNNIPLKLRI